jgi:hypothetical protein
VGLSQAQVFEPVEVLLEEQRPGRFPGAARFGLSGTDRAFDLPEPRIRALLHEEPDGQLILLALSIQTIRTETGIPSLVIWLRALHPIFTSVR